MEINNQAAPVAQAESLPLSPVVVEPEVAVSRKRLSGQQIGDITKVILAAPNFIKTHTLEEALIILQPQFDFNITKANLASIVKDQKLILI